MEDGGAGGGQGKGEGGVEVLLRLDRLEALVTARHLDAMNRIANLQRAARRLKRSAGIDQGSGFTSPSQKNGEDSESDSFKVDDEEMEEERADDEASAGQGGCGGGLPGPGGENKGPHRGGGADDHARPTTARGEEPTRSRRTAAEAQALQQEPSDSD